MGKSIQARALAFAKTNYRRINSDKIKHADFSFVNQRCHTNAVASVRAGRADKVWLVMGGDENEVFVHFINSKDGVFFDETWHETDIAWHYYIIRQVDEAEFSGIADLLYSAKESLVLSVGTWLERRAFYKDKDAISI